MGHFINTIGAQIPDLGPILASFLAPSSWFSLAISNMRARLSRGADALPLLTRRLMSRALLL